VCNPSGIALSILEACREIREHETTGTKETCQDPAIRMMVYQLASIGGVAEYTLARYTADEAACMSAAASKPPSSSSPGQAPAPLFWHWSRPAAATCRPICPSRR
jgi:hypothetical protein